MKQGKRVLAWVLSFAMLLTGVVPETVRKAEAKVTAMAPFTVGVNYLSKEGGESITPEQVSRRIKGDGTYYLSFTAGEYTSAIRKLSLSTGLYEEDMTEDFRLTVQKVSVDGASYALKNNAVWGPEEDDASHGYGISLIDLSRGQNVFGKDLEVFPNNKIQLKIEVSGMGSDLDEPADHLPQAPRVGSDGETLWDCVWFGNYLQRDTNGDGSINAKDQKLPVKWRVLSVEGNDAFLMADQLLDRKSYNETRKSVTWKTCTMRSWLNGYDDTQNTDGKDYSEDNFLETAFDAEEQEAIRETTVHTEDSSSTVVGGDDTQDKVYLASKQEVLNTAYGFTDASSVTSTRYAKGTGYAKQAGGRFSNVEDDTYGNGYWWLRSPGYYQDDAEYADQQGSLSAGWGVSDHDPCVRPVLHLDLSQTNVWSYAGQVSSEGYSHEINDPEDDTVSDLPLAEEEGYTAFLRLGAELGRTDSEDIYTTVYNNSVNWENGGSGYGTDAVITGNGTYTVSVERSAWYSYSGYNQVKNLKYLSVDFASMDDAYRFDMSDMTIQDVKIQCDGTTVASDSTKIYMGPAKNRGVAGTFRMEIYDENEEDNYLGSFGKTKKDPGIDVENFSFRDTLSITFTLVGIRKGRTPEGSWTDGSGNRLIKALAQKDSPSASPALTGKPSASPTGKPSGTPAVSPTRKPSNMPSDTPAVSPTRKPSDVPSDTPAVSPTRKPSATPSTTPTRKPTATPKPTETPDQENQAFLMFADSSYGWGNWNTRVTGGVGRDALITGNGTYTVSINKDDFIDAGKESCVENPAEGALVFCVDIMGICNTQKFDASNLAFSNVVVKADGRTIKTDLAKMYEGHIEDPKGNYRLEIRNEWGYGDGEFLTKDEFDKMNPDFTFENSLSVTFTIKGIKKGKTPEGAFETVDGKGVVATGGDREKAADAAGGEDLDATQKPRATRKPGATVKPVETQKPGATAKPIVTRKPGATEKPTDTMKPGATRKPGSTAEPEQTTKPEGTMDPQTSSLPENSLAPGSSGAPGVTASPVTSLVPGQGTGSGTGQTDRVNGTPSPVRGGTLDDAEDTTEADNPVRKLKAVKKLTIKKGKTKKVTLKLVAEDNTRKTTDKVMMLISNRKRVKISAKKLQKGKYTFKVKAKQKGAVVITVIIGTKMRRIKVKCK